MCDFPTHDMAADFVLLAEQRQVESDLKEQYEVGAYLRGSTLSSTRWVYKGQYK